MTQLGSLDLYHVAQQSSIWLKQMKFPKLVIVPLQEAGRCFPKVLTTERKLLHKLDRGERLFGFMQYGLTARSRTPAASLMMSVSPRTCQRPLRGWNNTAFHFSPGTCQSYLREVYEQSNFKKRMFINNITWYLNIPKHLRTKPSDVCWYLSFKS